MQKKAIKSLRGGPIRAADVYTRKVMEWRKMAEKSADSSNKITEQSKGKKSEREARSAKALRENLKKRRQQIRDRQDSKTKSSPRF